MTSRSNRTIIEDHYAASAAKDLDAMVADFAPDIAWTEMAGFPYAGLYVGPDAVKEGVFIRIGSEWTGYDALPDQIVADGDVVVGFGRYVGVHNGTGRPVEARFTHKWTLADGVVVAFEQFTDTQLFARAMDPTA